MHRTTRNALLHTISSATHPTRERYVYLHDVYDVPMYVSLLGVLCLQYCYYTHSPYVFNSCLLLFLNNVVPYALPGKVAFMFCDMYTFTFV